VSLFRLSPAIFIKNDDEFVKFKKKYNNINFFFGPWTLFKGPIHTYRAYKTNQKGGIDVTKDIMLNLTQEDLSKNKVLISYIHNIFSKTSKSDSKDILKAIRKININTVPLKNVYVGFFNNVEEHEAPFTVIGIELYKDELGLDIEYIKEKLYKVFYKHVHFEIINLNQKNDFSEKLIEQGELIYSR
jgi:hypothetical protein